MYYMTAPALAENSTHLIQLLIYISLKPVIDLPIID